MTDQRDRVIFDTNIWISLLLSRDFSKLDELIFQDKITLILSKDLIVELVEVTQRVKFKKYFDLDYVENMIAKIKEIAEIIDVVTSVAICRDPEDDFLLSLAIDGKATHLITGDKDLLVLKNIDNTSITTLSAYLSTK